MNIGIYVDHISDIDKLNNITNLINSGKRFKDISIFYNEIGPVKETIRCGVFNSTDLWNFRGHLIVTSATSLLKAKNIVNNISLIYYHSKLEESKSFNIFVMLEALKVPHKIICETKTGEHYIKRISGINTIELANDIEELVGLIQ